jgi:Domain of unknown function (DUF2828)
MQGPVTNQNPLISALKQGNTTNRTVNEKGAVAFKSTLNPCLDIFFQFVRDADKKLNIPRLLEAAWEADPLITLKIIFQLRDIRGGKGERKLGRTCLLWLAQNHPNTLKANLWAVVEFGRWDDLFCLWTIEKFWPTALEFISTSVSKELPSTIVAVSKIAQDKDDHRQADAARLLEKLSTFEITIPVDAKPVGKTSLLGKWLPSEKCKWSKGQFKGNKARTGLVKSIALSVGSFCTEKAPQQCWPLYRLICSTLRMPLELVETALASKQANTINFNAVPSQAMRRLGRTCGNKECTGTEVREVDPSTSACKKCKALVRQDHDRYWEYLDELTLVRTKPKEAEEKGVSAKVNARTLQPHEVMQQYIKGNFYNCNATQDEILESMWVEIRKRINPKALGRMMCMVDTSESMTRNAAIPLLVAFAMGILISECVEGEFHRSVITFTDIPEYHHVTGETLLEQVKSITKMRKGYSTEFRRALELLLNTAVAKGLKQEDLPDTLLVLTDGQFDEFDRGYKHGIAAAAEMYQAKGYTMPRVVLWNLAATGNFPSATDQGDNITLMSGFSPDVLNCMLEGKEFDPSSAMTNVLNQERYNKLKVIN